MATRFVKLTQSSIKALAPGKAIEEHGIKVERTKAGDLRYVINAMVDGKRISRAMGMASAGMTRQQCEAALEVLRTRAREERLDLPKGRKLHRSFKDAAKEYVELQEASGGKNLPAKRRHLELALVPAFGSSRIDQITTLMVERFVVARLKDIRQSTLNRELATLTHLFNRMVEWKWMVRDAVPSIRKGPEPRKQMRVLSDDDANALLNSAKVDVDDRLWLFAACGLYTAMRHSEILRIRYEHIDFANHRIHVPLAKAGQRNQPIAPALTRLLAEQHHKDGGGPGWVFPARGSVNEHRESYAKQFRRAVERAKLDPKFLTPHTMRHSAITRLIKAGIDIPTVARISGHKTLAMVLQYTHLDSGHVDRAIQSLDWRTAPPTA